MKGIKIMFFLTVAAAAALAGCAKSEAPMETQLYETSLPTVQEETDSEIESIADIESTRQSQESPISVEQEFLPENLQISYNKLIGNFVEEQQELYADRNYLTPSVSVTKDAAGEGFDYTIIYSFTGEGIELTLTKSRDIWYELVLSYQGSQLVFEGGGWDILSTPDYYDVYLSDLTGDGQDELVVMYTERAVMDTNDGIYFKAIALDSMTLLDTEAWHGAVEAQLNGRREQETLYKDISVWVNGFKEKYAGSGNGKVYAYYYGDGKQDIYLVVVENGEVAEGKYISAASGSSTIRQLTKEQAEEIMSDAGYRLAGIRIL